jgi:large-conductance mechanosensitive channel
MSCPKGEYETIEYTDKKKSSLIGISLLSAFSLIFSILFIVFYDRHRDTLTTSDANKYVFGRLTNFFGGSVNFLSLGLIVAIMATGVVNTLNLAVIKPIIQVSFPDQDIFTKEYEIGRGVFIYPGQFLLSILGFLMSILIIFFLIEIVTQFVVLTRKLVNKIQLKTNRKISISGPFMLALIFIILLLALLCWNIYDVITVKQCTNVPVSQQLASNGTQQNMNNHFINPYSTLFT